MAKKKKQQRLYYKGKPLTNFKKDFVLKSAEAAGKKVNTPKRLKKFFEDNKEDFAKKFDFGLQSKPKSSTQVFGDIDKAEQYGKKFFIKDGNKLKEVSPNDLKFKISLTELNLNTLFESTGSEFSYEIDFYNNIIMKFPEMEDEEFYTDESMEVIVDHFNVDYGINIYVSEPKNKNQRELHKQYREEYTNKIKSRINKYKPRGKTTNKGRNGRKKN